MWGSLPFFGKFTGDGVLFLWDTDLSTQTGIGNIAISLQEICEDYTNQLVPKLDREMTKVPERLRVGIARGQILSIGEDKDFVGPCINMAARLHKLASLSFAVSRRGFDPREYLPGMKDDLLIKRIPVRGVGTSEPVIVLKEEFEGLSHEEKEMFI